MDDKTKKELQAMIDKNYELAKHNVEQKKSMGWSTVKLEDELMFFICWDLQRLFGLDLKGVIPE